MSGELGIKAAVCGEYEVLLDGSRRALKTWHEERAAICESGAQGRELDLELLRSQARYARAYARLQRHVRECSRCQVVASMAQRTESGAGTQTELHCYD